MGPHNANDFSDSAEVSSDDVPAYHFSIMEESLDEAEDSDNAYELLPQIGEDISDLPEAYGYSGLPNEPVESENSDDESANCKESVSGVAKAESDDSVEKPNDINLDAERIEKIKSLMSGFTLPNSAIPGWASRVSEQDWKQLLDAKINKDA